MATEMQKKQFIMGNIMESFLISKFNLSDSPTYDILAKMYDYANLNSNKELVRRLNKRRNLSTNIQSSVYEDAAYIVAERIVEDKTGVLKDLYVDLMQKKFPNVKALIDKINPTDDIVEARLKLKNPNERLPMLALVSLKYDAGILKLSLKKNRFGGRNVDVLLKWDIDKGIIEPMLNEEELEQMGEEFGF